MSGHKDPEAFELSRHLNGSAEQIFDAWMDPEGVGKWWFATQGGEMKRVELDPRVGGRFFIAEQRGDSLAEHFGEFLVLEPPRRLVFQFATKAEDKPTLVTVDIHPLNNRGCSVTISHEIAPEWLEYRDLIESGWTGILTGLDKLLLSAKK